MFNARRDARCDAARRGRVWAKAMRHYARGGKEWLARCQLVTKATLAALGALGAWGRPTVRSDDVKW